MAPSRWLNSTLFIYTQSSTSQQIKSPEIKSPDYMLLLLFIPIFYTVTSKLVFFLNQQFITWSARADCGSYFVTTYMEPEPTGEKREKKRKGKKNEKERERNNR